MTSSMVTLAVDAMGGDAGLAVTLPATVAFLRQQQRARVMLMGDESAIRAYLGDIADLAGRLDIVHASEIVDMDESPQSALKNKKNSSMRLAIDAVKSGQAQAAVSAGNTGALMATARFVLKTLQGIDRPAIAKFLPKNSGRVTCVLDLGANVDSTPEQIAQFAFLGCELVRVLQPDSPNPRVGLLNIGTEEIKGTDSVKAAHALLQKTHLNFIGNIESNDIFSDDVDVVACDGFVGNITLKAIEGTAKMVGQRLKDAFQSSAASKLSALAAMPVLKKFQRSLDPRRYNGAIFLGLNGIVIKSHGGTDAVGFNYALQEAWQEANAGIIEALQQGVAAHIKDLKDLRTDTAVTPVQSSCIADAPVPHIQIKTPSEQTP